MASGDAAPGSQDMTTSEGGCLFTRSEPSKYPPLGGACVSFLPTFY